MGDLLIRDVPEELERKLADAARRAGHSLSDEARRMLMRGMGTHQEEHIRSSRNAYQELRDLFAPLEEDGDEFARIMDEITEPGRRTPYVRSASTNDRPRYQHHI